MTGWVLGLREPAAHQDVCHHVCHDLRLWNLLLAEAPAFLHACQVEVLHTIGVVQGLAGAQSNGLQKSTLQAQQKQCALDSRF